MKKIDEMTFEEKLNRLSDLAKSMEQDNLSLDRMLECYEESQILIKDLKTTIDNAKKKIESYNIEENN